MALNVGIKSKKKQIKHIKYFHNVFFSYIFGIVKEY